MRITDNQTKADFAGRISAQQSRVNMLNERILTGKKINRASDDPQGAQIVLNLRTSQTEIKQFENSAKSVTQKLTAADDALNSFENVLTSARTAVSRGLTTTNTPIAREALATELESLRDRMLSIVNIKNGDEYLFGGTRQNAAPFDQTTAAPATASSSAQFVQIEPGANAIAAGVTAEKVFADANSDIFADLTDAINALRGTGDQAADKTALQNTMSRMDVYQNSAAVARAQIGANMNLSESAQENLSSAFTSLDQRAADIEGADFAETALALADADKALNASLQVAAKGRRSLFDFL